MKKMMRKAVVYWISTGTALNLCGCNAMMSSQMPASKTTMAAVYQQAINGTDEADNSGSIDALRQHIASVPLSLNHHDEVTSSLAKQFPLLPNPRLAMYVYGHYVKMGNEQIPIPAYTTVFSLYVRNYYKLPIR